MTLFLSSPVREMMSADRFLNGTTGRLAVTVRGGAINIERNVHALCNLRACGVLVASSQLIHYEDENETTVANMQRHIQPLLK